MEQIQKPKTTPKDFFLNLGAIAILPLILRSITGIQSLAIGGTALLIVVSVVIDLVKKIDAQISVREY